MRILLDTVTFLWLVEGSGKLTTSVKAAFSDPQNEVFLSSVSAWEIAIKHRLGKLPLPSPPAQFVLDLRQQLSIETLALDEASALQLSKLPSIHQDPFDRMLICQAIEHALTLVTPDPDIRQYPVRTLW